MRTHLVGSILARKYYNRDEMANSENTLAYYAGSRLTKDKHSSLFCLFITDEEIKVL
jgi:hypothetical protein